MQSWYHRGLLLGWAGTALLTLVLIGLGIFVSSSGYGLAIPDWPLMQGGLIPPQLVAGIWYEFLHRLTAATVGVLTLAVGIYLQMREARPEVRRLGLTAVLLVLTQILLGGLGVLWEFPVWLGFIHALLPPLFFALLVVLATVYCWEWQEQQGSPTRFEAGTLSKTRWLALLALTQIVLGVAAGHAEAEGLFVVLLLLHLITALGVTVVALDASVAIFKQLSKGPLRVACWVLVLLVLMQLAVGFGVLLLSPEKGQEGVQPEPAFVVHAMAHGVLAALLLGTSAYLAMMVRRKNALAGPGAAELIELE